MRATEAQACVSLYFTHGVSNKVYIPVYYTGFREVLFTDRTEDRAGFIIAPFYGRRAVYERDMSVRNLMMKGEKFFGSASMARDYWNELLTSKIKGGYTLHADGATPCSIWEAPHLISLVADGPPTDAEELTGFFNAAMECRIPVQQPVTITTIEDDVAQASEQPVANHLLPTFPRSELEFVLWFSNCVEDCLEGMGMRRDAIRFIDVWRAIEADRSKGRFYDPSRNAVLIPREQIVERIITALQAAETQSRAIATALTRPATPGVFIPRQKKRAIGQ